MKEHINPDEHLNQFMTTAAQAYVHGLNEHGMKPGTHLDRIVSERVRQEAYEDFKRRERDILDDNVNTIMFEYNQRIKTVRRASARMRLIVCLTIALSLLIAALVCYLQGNGPVAAIQAAGALIFLGILVIGAYVDRPVK